MKLLKGLGGLLLTLVLALLVWGSLIEPRFLLDVQRHEAEVPHLPPSWDGQTVALLADLQVGMWGDNEGMIRKAVQRTLDADPALVLFAGDFVYHADSATVRDAVALVQPLAEAGVPTFAVLGNHDYSLSEAAGNMEADLARYVASELEAAGIGVLENEAEAMSGAEGEAPLYVVGVGSHWAQRSRPDEALAGVPDDAARVVVMHNPAAFREMDAGTGPLVLAAHTHGGQIRIPGTPSETWLHIAREREVVADGWASDSLGAPGNRLYVNRGLGFSAVPLRIRCRPELTLFTLRLSEDTLPEREPGSAE